MNSLSSFFLQMVSAIFVFFLSTMAATVSNADVSSNADDSNQESLSSSPASPSSSPSSSASSSFWCSSSSPSSFPPPSSSPSTSIFSSSPALPSSKFSFSGLVSVVNYPWDRRSREKRGPAPSSMLFGRSGSSHRLSLAWYGVSSGSSQNGAGETRPSRPTLLMPVPRVEAEKGKGKEGAREEKEKRKEEEDEDEEEDTEQKRMRIYEEGDRSQWYRGQRTPPRGVWP